MGWEIGDTVVTDSNASLRRITNMRYERARGWIEGRVVAAAGSVFHGSRTQRSVGE